MLIKIALLAAAAGVVWWLTRPRPKNAGDGGGGARRLAQCGKCGVYAEPGAECGCGKKGKTDGGGE